MLTVAGLAGHLGVLPAGHRVDPFAVVTGIGDDSRTLAPGEAYVAIPGRAVHGLDF